MEAMLNEIKANAKQRVGARKKYIIEITVQIRRAEA
jgi:hypothetical protein